MNITTENKPRKSQHLLAVYSTPNPPPSPFFSWDGEFSSLCMCACQKCWKAGWGQASSGPASLPLPARQSSQHNSSASPASPCSLIVQPVILSVVLEAHSFLFLYEWLKRHCPKNNLNDTVPKIILINAFQLSLSRLERMQQYIYMYSIYICTVYMYSIHMYTLYSIQYMYSIYVQYICTVYICTVYICTVYMYSIYVQYICTVYGFLTNISGTGTRCNPLHCSNHDRRSF